MKRIFWVLMLSGMGIRGVACDVCGGGMFNGVGLYNINNRNYVGISSVIDRNSYYSPVLTYFSSNRTININGALSLLRRWQVEAQVPYVLNARKYPDNSTLYSRGMGDIRLGINRFFTLKNDSSLSIWAKAGIFTTLPTGITHSEVNSYYLQPGSRTLSEYFSGSMVVRKDKWNYVLQTGYRTTVKSYSDYRFGNLLDASLLVKYALKKDNISILPQAGCAFQQKEYDVRNNFFQVGTHYSFVQGITGAQIMFKNSIFGTLFYLPVWYKNEEKGLRNKTKINFYLTQTF